MPLPRAPFWLLGVRACVRVLPFTSLVVIIDSRSSSKVSVQPQMTLFSFQVSVSSQIVSFLLNEVESCFLPWFAVPGVCPVHFCWLLLCFVVVSVLLLLCIWLCCVQESHCLGSSSRRSSTSSTCWPEVLSNQAQSHSEERIALSSGSCQQHEVKSPFKCATSVSQPEI